MVVYNGNEDISLWFCNVRAFLVFGSYFHLATFGLKICD